MPKLSKSIDEYLSANGWSSHLFFDHAKMIFADPRITRTCTFEVGRTVIYVRSMGKMLKVYVHANGRTKEFMTLKDESGDELKSFHYKERTENIIRFMLDYFQE